MLNVPAVAVFAATIAAVIVRQVRMRGPPAWLLFLAGAFATVVAGALTPAAAGSVIAARLPILLFLLALFLFATALEQAGVLDHVARWLLSMARRVETIPFALFVGLGLLSAFLVNDALVLVGVPLLFALARRRQLPVRPLLLTLAYAVTVGSVLTPLGNPQNLLVASESGLSAPFAVFLRYLAFPTAVNLYLGGLYLRRVYGPELAKSAAAEAVPAPARVRFFPPGPTGPLFSRAPVVWLFPATVLALLVTDATSALEGGPAVPLYAVALGGAILLLLLTPGRSALFARVDWTILVLFAGLFVVVQGAVNGGLLPAFSSILPVPTPGPSPSATGVLLLTGLGGSQLVSNVPWVALEIPALHAAGYAGGTPVAWVALAAGSTLAGNLTLLGAASNLIVVEQAERAGIRIGLREFVRHGAPLTAISVAVVFVSLSLGL